MKSPEKAELKKQILEGIAQRKAEAKANPKPRDKDVLILDKFTPPTERKMQENKTIFDKTLISLRKWIDSETEQEKEKIRLRWPYRAARAENLTKEEMEQYNEEVKRDEQNLD